MKKTFLLIITAVILIGCGRSNEKSAAKSAHENWLVSLNDTIDSLNNVITDINDHINSNNAVIDTLLLDFEIIDDPVLVEKYFVPAIWKDYDIMKQGIYARMLEDNSIELKATAKGVNFEAIELTCNNEKITSDTVRHDQALNYRVDGHNIVAFNGTKVPELCRFIHINKNEPIVLSFIGKKKTSITLTDRQKENISKIYSLWFAFHENIRMQTLLPALTERIKFIELKIDESGVMKNRND